MRLAGDGGAGTAVTDDGRTVRCAYRRVPSSWDDNLEIMIEGDGEPFEVKHYHRTFDVYFNMSGDGGTIHSSVRLLGPGDRAESPTPDECLRSSDMEVQPLMAAVGRGAIEAADLEFALQALKNPAWIHKAWQETGSVPAAQRKVLKDLWGVQSGS